MADDATFEKLDEYLEGMIDAAIELDLYLRAQGFLGSVGHGFAQAGGPWVVTPISGADRTGGGIVEYNGATGPGGIPVGPVDDARGRLGYDVQLDVVQHWQSVIRDAFDDWRHLPTANQYETAKTGATSAVTQLATTPTISDEGSVDGNGRLSDDVNTLTKTLSDPDAGLTMLAFQRAYLSPLPKVLEAQHGAATRALLAIATEQKLWDNVRTDIANIAAGASATMIDSSPNGGSGWSWGGAIQAVGTLATVAGLVSGGSLAPVVGVVGTVAGLLGQVVPPKEKTDLAFDGGNPQHIVDQMLDAIKRERDYVHDEERAVEQVLHHVLEQTYTKGEDIFLLRDDSTLLESTDAGEIIKVDPEVVASLAQTEMVHIAQEVSLASDGLASTLDGFAWVRPSSIGTGQTGPYPKLTEYVNRVQELIADTVWQTNAARAHLVTAVKVIKGADDGAQGRLQRQAKKVDEHDRPSTVLPIELVVEDVRSALFW